jgi:3-methyladenine DNA glycosylase AlkD
MNNQIISDLFRMRDEKFAKFNANLIPNISDKKIIGIRTPELRKYAKNINNINIFLNKLPHQYFEENQIHAFILSEIRDFETCINYIDKFLPHIDNWATCDQLVPKIFAKNIDKLLPYIEKWIKSKHIYTVRFAIGLLMRFYLGDKFSSKYADMVANIKTDEYYINMMRAWYFATGLVKNWDEIVCLLENKKWIYGHIIKPSKNPLNHIVYHPIKNNIWLN